MTAIRVIAVPYELGRLRDGVGLGPERLLEHGAAAALAGRGATVETTLIELAEPDDNEVDTSFAVIGRIAEAVRAARASGEFPVVLSGSCLAAVGVVAGLGEPAPGVVWFDAHPDFNEPSSAVYGYLDGMGTAILVGDAWQGLAVQVPGFTPLPETGLVFAGARALDEPERARIEASATARAPVDPEALTGAVASLEPRPTGLYLHVDLDVLDAGVARVNRYAAEGGATAAELEAALRALLADERVAAVSFTAYEPGADPEARVPPIALRLLGAVAESRERVSYHHPPAAST
jgi:arginase